MKWFKTLWLTSEEREILRAGRQKPEPVPVPATEIDNGKPYKNVFYSNKNLTVVFKDGSMISKSNVTDAIFRAVRDSRTEKEIETLLVEKVEIESETESETPQERELVSRNLDVLRNYPDFVVQGSQVTLKGVNLAMPASVIASFIEILEKQEGIPLFHAHTEDAKSATRKMADLHDQYHALKMFWLKLALNTLPQSREDLLVFVRKNDVRITRNGNLILYRRIVTKTGADTQLVTFVTQEYYRLKKAREDTRNYAVGIKGDYLTVDLRDEVAVEVMKDGLIGNLQIMYLELPTFDTNTFTSAHDAKVEIKIGGIYKIGNHNINLDNGICAAGGLHAAAVDYNYSGFGDLPVVVLVNPSKAITVPLGDMGKLRTTEMFIACVNDKPQGTHFDEGALAAFDSEYHDLTLFELEEAAKNKSFEGLSVKDTVPAVSLVDLNQIRAMLKDRIKDF